MLLNYLKTAWRNFHRNKFFSALNIMGMTLGIAAALLILLWVQHEKSIDAFHANSNRIYMVYEREYYSNTNTVYGNYDMSGLLGDELKRTFPEVEAAVMMNGNNEFSTFSAGDKSIKQQGLYAGKDLFKVFSYPLLQGTPATVLSSQSNIAISHKMASHFFGSPEAAMGKTIRYENRRDYIITGVFENIPSNASRSFDYVISWDTYLAENAWARRWNNTGPLAYVLLHKNANAAAVDTKLTHFLKTVNPGNSTYRAELGLQLYKEAYLYNHFNNGYPNGGRIEYVRLFSIVALFILLIACINFMNLTTARSVKRGKEIGIRKVAGALRISLIKQFIGEAVLMTLIAVITALLLITTLLPLFNQITHKDIQLPLNQPVFWLQLLAIIIGCGLLAGSYPALHLSSLQPVRVLKGTLKTPGTSFSLRRVLVVFQFSMSVLLIIGTIVISGQVRYIQQKNLGYDRDNIVNIPIEGELVKQYKLLRQKALEIEGITAVTRMSTISTNVESHTSTIDWENRKPDELIEFSDLSTGYGFTNTLKLQMADGRDFSPDHPADSNSVLLNETAVKAIGYTHPVGRSFTLWGKKKTIVGVLKDFHMESLHVAIKPLVVYFRESNQTGYLMARIAPGKTKEALAGLEAVCKTLNPDFPFSYTFTDEQYQRLYRNEQIVGNLSAIFAALAIFISCLGLLGLAMFTAEQRIREIGIRKVLGASVHSLFILLSREFLLLVFIALLIASPLSWWIMNNWLQQYAYRISIGWQVFLIAGIASILIALVTVSVQTLKAALLNPVKSLKEN